MYDFAIGLFYRSNFREHAACTTHMHVCMHMNVRAIYIRAVQLRVARCQMVNRWRRMRVGSLLLVLHVSFVTPSQQRRDFPAEKCAAGVTYSSSE